MTTAPPPSRPSRPAPGRRRCRRGPGWRTTTPAPAPVTVGSGPVAVALGVTRVSGLDGPAGRRRRRGRRPRRRRADHRRPARRGHARGRHGDAHRQQRRGRRGRAGRQGRHGAGAACPTPACRWPCTTASVTTASGTAAAHVRRRRADRVPAGSHRAGPASAPSARAWRPRTLFDDANRDGERGATEAPLADWPVALATAAGTEVARTTTDVEGRTTAVVAPGTYRVVPQAPAAGVAWTSTAAIADVVVARAGTVGRRQRLGAAGVGVRVGLPRPRQGRRARGRRPAARRPHRQAAQQRGRHARHRLHRWQRPGGLPGQGRDRLQGATSPRSARGRPPRRAAAPRCRPRSP